MLKVQASKATNKQTDMKLKINFDFANLQFVIAIINFTTKNF